MSFLDKMLGKDVSGLVGDQLTAFTKRLGGMVDDTANPFTAEMRDAAISHFEHHTGKSGGRLTEDALEGIIADAKAGLKPGEGALLSNVSEGNILTNAFNVDASGGIGGNVAAMGMGGLLGFAGAAATDGDGAHGAFIGSLVGGGIKGIGTGLARNMEKKFVGDLLGDKAGSYTAKEATEAVAGTPGVSKFGLDDVFDHPKGAPDPFNGPDPFYFGRHESKTYGEIAQTHPNMTPKEMDDLMSTNSLHNFSSLDDYARPLGELGDDVKNIRPFVFEGDQGADIAAFELRNPTIFREAVEEIKPAPAQAAQSVRQQQSPQ